MEKRKWLWKRKSSEKSPVETDSSGSISSHSERYSDDQEAFKASPNHSTQSPEATSKTVANGEEIKDSITMKNLTQKLSAALVNVSAKEDLVKQHAKVSEEAIAGWEKAENEVVVLKLQLEAAIQQMSAVEDRVNHLDGALKECVRQLRQAKEEQEQKIHEAVVRKTHEWESTKSELESQLLELQNKAEAVKYKFPTPVVPDHCHKLERLEEENSALGLELLSQSEELEIRTIERDLSTQAAETASKQYLESIKKLAKLEAECQKLKAIAYKSSSANDHKSAAASSIYIESFTDSQSDSAERLNAVEMGRSEPSKGNLSCLELWASALVSELGQIKNEKTVDRNLTSSSIEIDLMDDFLEMERLAALPNTESGNCCVDSEAIASQSISQESSLRAELEAMIHRTTELEEKLEKMEAENAELEMALTKRQDCFEASQLQLREAEIKLEELQKELYITNESKHFIEAQLIGLEVEARTRSTKVESLEAEVKKERALASEIRVKCHELEEELSRKKHKVELQQSSISNVELKIKEDDLSIAAGKLAECQKTIASLGMQLKTLATLEDFLIDTTNLPELSGGNSLIHSADEELWNLHSKKTFSPKRESDPSRIAGESSGPSMIMNDGNSRLSSSSSTSSASMTLNCVSSEKSRNGFSKFFTRSKNGIQLEI